MHLPVWRNWQTRRTQNPVVAISYRFDPDHRYKNGILLMKDAVFLFAAPAGISKRFVFGSVHFFIFKSYIAIYKSGLL